jgi:ketosteroid isomerase-like protein
VRLLAWTVLAMAAFSASERQTAADGAGDRDAIRELLERFVDAWNRSDAERAVSVYADPHVDVNAEMPLESRAQTLAKWQRFFDRFDSRIAVTSDELIVVGQWAIQRGELDQSVTPRAGGATSTRKRRYIEVLKKVDGGGWGVFWGIDGRVAKEITERALVRGVRRANSAQ